ncbi:hypothetical protein ACOMHN_049591 [Nucella lapillus]
MLLFEDVVEAIKPFGPYQRLQYALISLTGTAGAMHTMVTIFILATPQIRCAIPGLDNDTFACQGSWHDDLVSHTIPYDAHTGTWSPCVQYTHRNLSYPLHESNETSQCNRWVYSKEVFESTVISELNLVCEAKGMVTLANSILMGGLLAGSLVLGFLSDIIGRKKTMMIGLTGQFVVAMATGFVSSYGAFVALRFLTTFFGMGFLLAAFVAGMELVGPAQRTIAGIVIQLMWALGLFILLFLSYFIRHWRYLQIAVSCVNLFFIVHYFLIPESARWLASKGRLHEASAIIRKAARKNKASVPERVLSLQGLQTEEQHEKVWHLFTNPRLLLRCLMIFFNWMVMSKVYYGLGLNVGSLSGNLFLNFLFGAVAETLSYIFCLVLLYRVGRRPLHCFSMLLGGGACVATIFPVLYGSKDVQWVTITLSMVGRFGISAAFAIIFVYSAELFPTKVRNSGMGLSSFCARIGGIASPFIAALRHYVGGDFGVALPALVFGFMSMVAGLCALSLPETHNKKMPESVEDAKMFGRSDLEKKQDVYVLHSLSSDVDKESHENRL